MLFQPERNRERERELPWMLGHWERSCSLAAGGGRQQSSELQEKREPAGACRTLRLSCSGCHHMHVTTGLPGGRWWCSDWLVVTTCQSVALINRLEWIRDSGLKIVYKLDFIGF